MSADPRTYRVSPSFVLSDFLGNHTAYSRGYANPFEFDGTSEAKLENLKALCYEGLEPILAAYGPMSISYGFISPAMSREIVKYQSPDKPSHHRFDLGAAADICVHKWVSEEFNTIVDLYAPGTTLGSPIALAHAIDYLDIPYSRLITYSESPYLCLAISAQEVVADAPRKAFYENRYTGKAKVKPDYKTYSTPQARARALADLQENGLAHPWRGGGFPSYHGGGTMQYQHMRVSKYTMVSDWLFDLKSISKGHKNIPCMHMEEIQDAFAAAGIVYDWMIDRLKVARLSIVEGYVSHLNPSSADYNDWRGGTLRFCVNPPEGTDLNDAVSDLNCYCVDGAQFTSEGEFIVAVVYVDNVLNTWE